MGFLTRCKRLFSFAFLLQNRNTFFSFFLKSFLILSEKQHPARLFAPAARYGQPQQQAQSAHAALQLGQVPPARLLCVILCRLQQVFHPPTPPLYFLSV
nr:MAG TPA: hypothetical protein [Caudoviricetes sp.]